VTLDNLSPCDLVTIVTKDGKMVQAEVRQVKRDRIQLNIKGPWMSDRQFKDAYRSIQIKDLAAVVRTGRNK
jgi:metal-sulfur cluster biosynthetic enzyme